jgi:uncharacterized protein
LGFACLYGSIETIIKLLDCGANPNIVDQYGISPLMHAVKHYNLDFIKMLVERGSNLHTCDSDFNTVLMHACYYENPNIDERISIVKFLLEHGVNINSKNKIGKTALFFSTNVTKMFKLLLDNGIDTNICDKDGNNILITLCEYYAENRINQIAQLLKYKVNVNAQNKFKYTALMYICESVYINIDIVNLLIDTGSNLLATNYWGKTALVIAAGNKNATVNIISSLVSAGSVVDEIYSLRKTALSHAIESRNVDIVNMLISMKSDVCKIDSCDQSILSQAIFTSNYDVNIIKALLYAGTDIKKYSWGDTILMRLVRSEYVSADIVSILIDAGVDILEFDNKGKSALMHAAYNPNQNTQVISLLIKAGSNVFEKDMFGKTALIYSVINTNLNIDIVKMLLDAGL